MSESPLNAALRQFEATEANIVKAEKALSDMEALIPDGIAFGGPPAYDEHLAVLLHIVQALPKIDGWTLKIAPMSLDEIAQCRLDALESDMFESRIYVEQSVEQPSRMLREYRFRFDRKRRELVRESLLERIDAVDAILRELAKYEPAEDSVLIEHERFDDLKTEIAQISVLHGGKVRDLPRWGSLNRHLGFGMVGDLDDIIKHDWPSVKPALSKSLYGDQDPVPVDIEDLGVLVSARPKGPVATKLKWASLDETEFERLIFALISAGPGYENPEWLMPTSAPDKGRDLSVIRVANDPLAGTIRHRVIIQCKHWQSKSVGVAEFATLKEQMKLWEPPKVDVHVIATSGRFTADSVSAIERHNQSDSGLRVEMWPESHLERLLAARPHIIAEFKLR